jgi:hypothetical protein
VTAAGQHVPPCYEWDSTTGLLTRVHGDGTRKVSPCPMSRHSAERVARDCGLPLTAGGGGGRS